MKASVIHLAAFSTYGPDGHGEIGKLATHSNGYKHRYGKVYFGRHLKPAFFHEYCDDAGDKISKADFAATVGALKA